ncbi:MAG: hypothetical protein LBK03_02980 [Bacteroidales bacterium]|jgi:hypothetical protein|nr:hypothetical protein [Bacteroidales bacterium]
MKRIIFMLMAACVLLASSCKKPEELTLQEKPQRPGDTTTVTPDPPLNPNDSILPPHIEKWILFFSEDYPGCGSGMRLLWPMPENWYGPDARAITLNWRDSTYTSDAYDNIFQAIVPRSGSVHLKDTLIHGFVSRKIIFDNGISMSPFPEITEWFYWVGTSSDYTFNESWVHDYLTTYPEVPDQLVHLQKQYWPTSTPNPQQFTYQFFRLNPHDFYSDNTKSNQLIINNLKSQNNDQYKTYSKTH